jgi:aryl-phospho-beta-D-glucosidase BglC (GH1 family)
MRTTILPKSTKWSHGRPNPLNPELHAMKPLSYGLPVLLIFAVSLPAPGQDPAVEAVAPLPAADAHHLPRWRGFNLMNKFYFRPEGNGPFAEEDFRMIHELGFNFVRLPMDYRIWSAPGDWTRFNRAQLGQIDQAVAWGGRYGIHVCINFHRAPGYTVAQPAETRSLWSDAEAQRVCALHWSTFARRYRGVPNERLSFNLFNEPPDISPAAYAAVVRKMASAIRAEDPDRLILCDGLAWGTKPVAELASLDVAQATRGYTPMEVTHYRASWIGGSDRFPLPTWPRAQAEGTLYWPGKTEIKREARRPLSIEGAFPQGARLRLHVTVVSSQAHLVVKADGTAVWEKRFVCGPGKGEWKQARHMREWNTYQNLYDADYWAPIPAGTDRVEIAVTEGDWLQLSELGLALPNAAEDVFPLRSDWNQPPAQVRYRPSGRSGPFLSAVMEDRRWLWRTTIAPWKALEARGVGMMVGEFGCFNQTPHPVVLAWLEDCLAHWRRAGWGWAMWEFRGGFGVLDSQRRDVSYQDFHGHRLDRKMLDLLQRY